MTLFFELDAAVAIAIASMIAMPIGIRVSVVLRARRQAAFGEKERPSP